MTDMLDLMIYSIFVGKQPLHKQENTLQGQPSHPCQPLNVWNLSGVISCVCSCQMKNKYIKLWALMICDGHLCVCID